MLAALYYAPPTDEWLAQLRGVVRTGSADGRRFAGAWQQLAGSARSLSAQQIATTSTTRCSAGGQARSGAVSHYLSGFERKPLAAFAHRPAAALGLERDAAMQ